jgi:hypothetical protein
MAASDDEIRDGLALQRAGKWTAALECYLKAVAGDPGNSQGLFRAGLSRPMRDGST